MRNHLCIFCLILLSACSPRFDPCWPGFEPDLTYKYVCSRASKDCHLCLGAHSYDSYAVIGKPEKDWYGLKKSGEMHSWTDRQPMVRYRISEAGIIDWETLGSHR